MKSCPLRFGTRAGSLFAAFLAAILLQGTCPRLKTGTMTKGAAFEGCICGRKQHGKPIDDSGICGTITTNIVLQCVMVLCIVCAGWDVFCRFFQRPAHDCPRDNCGMVKKAFFLSVFQFQRGKVEQCIAGNSYQSIPFFRKALRSQ